MITCLDHIQLAMPTGEEMKARAFFHDALGMTELEKPEPLASRGGCWFAAGRAMLHLGVEKGFSPQQKAHPAFCVSDIEVLAERLLGMGFKVVWDDAFPERKRFYTSDPFGNRLEIIRDGDGFTQK